MILALLATALLGCAGATETRQPPQQTMLQQPPPHTTVIVVRHAEKVSEDRDTELSEAGWARARALGEVLRHAGVQAVVTTQRRRTQQTAQPLMERLGLRPEPTGMDDGAEANVREVVAAIRDRHAGKVVLVVGHSNTAPAIVTALGGPPLAKLCDSEFSHLFVVQLHADGRTTMLRSRYGAEDGPLPPECVAQ